MGGFVERACARRYLLSALLFISTFSFPAHASPWARPDGNFLIISRAEYFSVDLPPAQIDEPVGRFQRIESNSYAEYGLTDAITIGGKVIYGTTWLNNASLSHTQSGFSEIEGFGQYQILRNRNHAASLRFAVASPVQLQSGTRSSLLGKGVDLDFSALYGRDIIFRPIKIFAAAEIGYRKNIGTNADQIRSQLTLGTEPHERILFLLEAFGTRSMRNETQGGADFDVIKVQPSLVAKITNRWSIQAGMNREIAGRNLELGQTFFIGLWSRF
ncbi:hypothetical protein [Hyphococcus sp. DH-69]|uniref:hypothetical protein n=1 Tax=Hyphococcus formosus TaxID=3143534 RepID=UPI00398B7C91